MQNLHRRFSLSAGNAFILTVILCATAGVDAVFSLYPAIAPELAARAFNITLNCLQALNATVDCDQDLFSMAGNVDGFFWSDDNATSLCTSTCQQSASLWWSKSANACADDQLNAYGKLYPAETVPGRFLDGMNIVCVTTNTDVTQDIGVNGTIVTVTDLDRQNSTFTGTWSPEALATLQPVPYPDLVPRQSSESSQYCLVQSYDWTGSDIIRPDCEDPQNANASQCVDGTDVPPEHERMANLYANDLLCSKCFLNMFYLRLASPYLPDSDHSDYLVEQWFDILDVCQANASMPDLLVRSLPFYEWAPGEDHNWVVNTTSGFNDPEPLTGNQTYNATCQGRTLVLADLNPPSFDYSTQSPCDVMPPYLNMSTGDIWQMFGDPSCTPAFDTDEIPAVCAPLECSVIRMNANTTCDEFVTTISTSQNQITTTQFLSWNPNLIGLCDDTTAQDVCGGAPGGTYIPPPALNGSSNAGSQQRGGGDGSGTATGDGGVGGSGRNSTIVKPGGTAPSPTQSGISSSCTQYALAHTGDGCNSFSRLFGITPETFDAWNPILGSNGEHCSTLFFAGYWYCVGADGITTTPVTSPTASAVPSPVQSGINPQCTKYAEAVSGDDCTRFASQNSITADQLYSWNPILGSGGANCGTKFWASTYYCVGAPGASPTSTSGASPPGPTQSGITPKCNRFALAVGGDTCSRFAQEHGVTTTDLYAWNAVLGPNGENCNTQLFAGYDYCVGVGP